MQPLKKSEMFNYSIGDLGINFWFQFLGFYMAYFYTDIFKLDPWHMGTLFLSARIWDGINDPMMGYLADSTRTRWGRFRPYLIFGAIPLNIIMIMVFFVPELQGSAKTIYAYITYILGSMALTLVGLPYSSLCAVVTQDQQERSVISSWRMFFALVIAMGLIIGLWADWFLNNYWPQKFNIELLDGVKHTDPTAYFTLAIIFGFFSTLFIIFAGIMTKERLAPPSEKFRIKDILPTLSKNDALLTLGSALFFNTLFWATANAVTFHFYKYVFTEPYYVEIFGKTFNLVGSKFLFVAMIIGNAIAAFIAPIFSKFFGKTKLFIWGSGIVGILGILRYFVPTDPFVEVLWIPSIFLFLIVTLLATIGGMFCAIGQWGMVPDTVDYGEWKTGIRSEAIPFAFFQFTQKVGMGVAGAVVGWVFSAINYDADLIVQPENVQQAISIMFNILPGVFSLICMILLFKYKLDGELFTKIIKDLTDRKNQSTS